MKLVIMTTLYNASNYIERCILSVKNQKFKKFNMIITDDLSTDNSVQVAEKAIDNDPRFVIIKNSQKMYPPGNYYQISQLPFIQDEDVLITLDGDDWFADDNVLERVFNYYRNTNYLMTFGQFIHYHGPDDLSTGFTRKPDFNNLRGTDWTTSHLKTFKAKVFRKIKIEDLIGPNSQFWETTGDQAVIYPMLEMVGEENVYFTEDINMVYNVETQLNDYKVNFERQQEYSRLIKSKKPYERIF